MQVPHQDPCALLIDGDRIPTTIVGRALAFAQTTRNVTIRRVYANWGVEGIPQPWREVMEHDAICYQQEEFPASDHTAVVMILVIDALKLLHRDGIRSFFLVADERDYAPLVSELLHEQCAILGIRAPDIPAISQYPTSPYTLIETIGRQGDAESQEKSDQFSASS